MEAKVLPFLVVAAAMAQTAKPVRAETFSIASYPEPFPVEGPQARLPEGLTKTISERLKTSMEELRASPMPQKISSEKSALITASALMRLVQKTVLKTCNAKGGGDKSREPGTASPIATYQAFLQNPGLGSAMAFDGIDISGADFHSRYQVALCAEGVRRLAALAVAREFPELNCVSNFISYSHADAHDIYLHAVDCAAKETMPSNKEEPIEEEAPDGPEPKSLPRSIYDRET